MADHPNGTDHTRACYREIREITCTKPQHTHTTSCIVAGCKEKEHTHSNVNGPCGSFVSYACPYV